jgi:hypothetical protein
LNHQNMYSQMTNEKEYVIITFEAIYNNGHRCVNYYWIIPLDTANLGELKGESDKDFQMFYFYVFPYFSKSHLEDCFKGNLINVLESSSDDTIDFNNKELDSLLIINQIINKFKRKIQSIKYNWFYPRRIVVVNIFATPIIGDFCHCRQRFSLHLKKSFREGTIFLPISNFRYDPFFWKSKNAKEILNFDYSQIKFENTL